MGEPELQATMILQYQFARNHLLPILCTSVAESRLEPNSDKSILLLFQVIKIPNRNLLGRDAIVSLKISLDDILFSRSLQIPDIKTSASYPTYLIAVDQ